MKIEVPEIQTLLDVDPYIRDQEKELRRRLVSLPLKGHIALPAFDGFNSCKRADV